MKTMGYDYSRTAAQIETHHEGELTRIEKRLVDEIEKHIKGTGKVLFVDWEGVGMGWSVIVDTEYAALKAFYAYNRAPGSTSGVQIRKVNGGIPGWNIYTDK
jgi:hypothetical protein